MVGDTPEDIIAGRIVDVITFYLNKKGREFIIADHSVRNLSEVLNII